MVNVVFNFEIFAAPLRPLRRLPGIYCGISLLLWAGAFAYFAFFDFVEKNNEPEAIANQFIYIEPINGFFRRNRNRMQEKKDWHDYKQMVGEEGRQGPGEGGIAMYFSENETELNSQIFQANGYNAFLSDKISVNRSVPKCRHPE